MTEEKMLVSKIKNGTVIDKIPAGRSLTLLHALAITEDARETVAVGIRVDSQSMGQKDIIKITDRLLEEEDLIKIWLIAPKAVITKIVDFDVADKIRFTERKFSNEFVGVLVCNNPTCATNFREPVKPKFTLLQRDPILVRCLYCDRVMLESNVKRQL